MKIMKIKVLNGVKISINSNVKQVYCNMYPQDTFGEELNGDIILNDVWKCLLEGKDVYELLEIGDSEVRVRVFEMISVLKECDYETIWELWLHKGEVPLWISYRNLESEKICIIPCIDIYDRG